MPRGRERTNTIFEKRGALWFRYYDAEGTLRRKPSGLKVGEELKATKLLRELTAEIKRQKKRAAKGLPTGALTVRDWAKQWIESRSHVDYATDQAAHLKHHILPAIGAMRVDEIRPLDLRGFVLDLRAKSLAPKTVRNIWFTVKQMFDSARIHEKILTDPCVLEPGVLPPKEDADPEWRVDAIFTRDEVRTLVWDPRIAPDRRVLHAIMFLTGSRRSEITALRWRHYDAEVEPLGRLVVANSGKRKGTKTGKTRTVPVHPTLAPILAEWRRSGWEELVGRAPGPEDFLVPSGGGRRRPPGHMRSKNSDGNLFRRDLEVLGMRRRRGHDARRTLLSLAQDDGARREVMRAITHTGNRDVMSGYTEFAWSTLCDELSKLRIFPPDGSSGRHRESTTNEKQSDSGGSQRKCTGIENLSERANQITPLQIVSGYASDPVTTGQKPAAAGVAGVVPADRLRARVRGLLAAWDAGDPVDELVEDLRGALEALDAARAGSRRRGER